MNIRRARLALATVAGLGLGAETASAQIDYRNSDTHRPTRVADAYPVERYAFEFSLPYGLVTDEGTTRHAVEPHLDYGIARNVMVGIGADIRVGGPRTEPSTGSASLLWNLGRETAGSPGMSVAVESQFTSFDRVSVEVGGLFTRSIGRSRVHGNAAIRILESNDLAAALAPDWWAGLAWDYTLLRTSTLLIVELVAERPGSQRTTEWTFGGGVRRQLTPTVVLHGGVSRSLQGSGTEFNFGLSHTLAIADLMGRRGAR